MPKDRVADDLFRLTVEYSPTAVVMVDVEGCMTLANRQTELLFGHPRQSLLGQPIEMLVPQRLRDEHVRHRAGFLQAPSMRAMGVGRDLYGLRADGVEIPIEIGLNPIDTPLGRRIVASIIDITERRHAQLQIEAALREKTALLNEVHHRVKNNLQVISSLLALQAGVTRSDEARRALDESRGRVQAMSLTHQLLYERREFARVHLGQYLERLGRLLAQTLASPSAPVRVLVQASDAPIEVDIERAIPCGLVVNELAMNAVKHAFAGRRDGEIVIALVEPAEGEALLTVGDNGVGLPPGLSLQDTKTLGFQLIGILVEQIHGRLAVQEGPGARFEIRFPTRRSRP